MNCVGYLTRELRCTREPVGQVSHVESKRYQCVMGEIIGIVTY
jgi:hypothetical protein